jgi:DNA-binding transcriptional LysR family regulator
VPLLEEPVYLATPDDAGGGLAGLRDFPWIMATPGTLCHAVTVQLCRAAGFSPRARHHADDFTTVLALVAAGQGASIVPRMAITGPPVGVRLEELPTRRRTRIAYRRGAAGHPAVAAFVAAIRAPAFPGAAGAQPPLR